jgi:hypothetical protein
MFICVITQGTFLFESPLERSQPLFCTVGHSEVDVVDEGMAVMLNSYLNQSQNLIYVNVQDCFCNQAGSSEVWNMGQLWEFRIWDLD